MSDLIDDLKTAIIYVSESENTVGFNVDVLNNCLERVEELEKEFHKAVEGNIKYATALQQILGCTGSVSGCFTTTRDIARKALNEAR